MLKNVFAWSLIDVHFPFPPYFLHAIKLLLHLINIIMFTNSFISNLVSVWKQNEHELRKQILQSLLSFFSSNHIERTAHILGTWSTLLDSLFDYIEDPLCSDDVRVLAIRAIGYILRCKSSSFDLRKVLGLLRKFKSSPLLRDSVLRALEESARSRSSGRLPGCGAFWTLSGGSDEGEESRPLSAFLNVTLPPSPMSSNKDEQWWPFAREYGIFAMVRAERFEPGEGERCTSLLRAISYNGAKLQIWLSEKSVHVSVYEPLQQVSEPQPSVSAASVFSSLSAIASGPKPASAQWPTSPRPR